MAETKEKTTKKTVKKTTKTIKKTAPKKTGFAVIETGGKQYLVRTGDKIKIEKIEKPKKGTAISFDKVLLLVRGDDVKLGTPYLKTSKVKAEWLKEGRAKKITNVKYKSKTRQSTKKGHRQTYTEIIIGDF